MAFEERHGSFKNTAELKFSYGIWRTTEINRQRWIFSVMSFFFKGFEHPR